MLVHEIVIVSGAHLWTARQGHGPALVLCHGGPGLWDYLGPVAAMLDDLCTVYRYDQRACGRSNGTAPHTVERSVADLDALRSHFGHDEWFVAGHSWGATLALAYAVAFPARMSGLIYLCGTGIDPAWHAAYHAERDRRLGSNGLQQLEELRDRWHSEGTLASEHDFCELHREAQFRSAESLLKTLRKRLDDRISPELKRRIVEILVERVQADTVERWGVPQSEITVTYRFSQPNEPAALVLPRSHRLTSRNQPPEKLQTLGDHLRRRRLESKLIQRQVAEQIGVETTSICNWEMNRTKPNLEYMPAIIQFLGYNPVPPSDVWADRLVKSRMAVGLSQKRAAQRMGVDPCTLARWERGEREPSSAFAVRAERFVGAVEGTWTTGAARIA